MKDDNALRNFADDDFCYLTTTGRVTGKSHTIEIWFALIERTVYMLAGGGMHSDWVKNIGRNPAVTVRFGDMLYSGQARVIVDITEDSIARRSVVGKYE